MPSRKARRRDWYSKLSTVRDLANDIADLLLMHEPTCISRLAAEYWVESAGLTNGEFLDLWSYGTFNA